MRSSAWIAGMVSTGAVLAACDGAGPDASRDCPGDARLDRAYFDRSVAPIFERHCAVCHVPGGLAWGSTWLDLTADAAWDSLVGKPAVEMAHSGTPMLRVKPGCPDSSYLYLKVALDRPPVGSRMPLAEYHLTGAEIGAIRTWIKGRPHD